MKHKLDLTKSGCHVCGRQLQRDFERKLEWCENKKCVLHKVRFSIPFINKKKLASVERAIVREAK